MSDIASFAYIRYCWGKSSLGPFLAAWGDGIVHFEFVGDKQEALQKLYKQFPDCLVIEDIAGFVALNAQLAHLVDHPDEASNIPLDLRGSDFEKRVWNLLREIPAGTTVGYGDIAAKMGVRDVREVTAAIAANSVAILVPCHRVIKKDGSISGYRWGVQRKRALLDRERKPEELKLAS
jgi:AraC family transcriptional regulator of adaptative response/methylated-DNA-[protein]-cysteine methyltransferase